MYAWGASGLAAGGPQTAPAGTAPSGAPWIFVWILAGALLASLAGGAAALRWRNARRRRSGR